MASLTRDLTFFDVVSPFTFLTSWQQQASRPELTTFLKSFQHSMTQPSSQQEEEVGTVIVPRGHVGWGQGKSLSPSIRSQLWEKGRFKISPIFHHLSFLFNFFLFCLNLFIIPMAPKFESSRSFERLRCAALTSEASESFLELVASVHIPFHENLKYSEVSKFVDL